MRVINDYKCETCETVKEHYCDPKDPVICECGTPKTKKMPTPRMNGNCAHGMVFDKPLI